MDCLNSISLTCRLERDPHMKFEGDDIPVITFMLCVEEPDAEGAVHTTLVSIEAYGDVGEQAYTTLNANDLVGVEGRLQWRRSTDREDQQRGTLVVLARTIAVLVPGVVDVEWA